MPKQRPRRAPLCLAASSGGIRIPFHSKQSQDWAIYYDVRDEATSENVGQTLSKALIQNDPEMKKNQNQCAVVKSKRKQKNVSQLKWLAMLSWE